MIVRIYIIKRKINKKEEEKMNMNILFRRLNLDLIYGAQGSLNMRGEKNLN